MKTFLLILFGVLLSAHTARAGSAQIVVAYHSSIPSDVREKAVSGLATLASECSAGTRVVLLDGTALHAITSFVVPEGSLRLRQQRIAPAFARGAHAVRSATNRSANFDIPRILDHIAREIRESGRESIVILVGPSLFKNPKEPSFDLTSGWPSDGHLTAGPERSLFSTVERSGALEQTAVHWCVTDLGNAVNDAHRSGVERFWTLFIGTQGGVLSSFSPDPLAAFAIHRASRPVLTTRINPKDTDVTMRQAQREVRAERTAGLEPELTVVLPQLPPENSGFGIVWSSNRAGASDVDLDLYVQPPVGGPELFFGKTESAYGRYYRDIRHAQAAAGDWRQQWEFVEIRGEVLPQEVWINLYAGHGPVQGEFRLQHRGTSYSTPFSLPAVDGDLGSGRSQRANRRAWVKIQVSGR